MAAFATPTELAGFLQQDLDTYSATQALDIATQSIRDYCGWNITQETVTGQVIDVVDGCSVFLPTLQLTAVASITENGVALPGTAYYWTSYGELTRVGRWWTCKPRAIVVTYTHGYTTVPDSVKGVCMALAGRRYQNPGALRSYTVGGVSETYANSAGSGSALLDDELLALTPHKLEPVG